MWSFADSRTRRAAAIGKVEGMLDCRVTEILSGSRSGICRKNLSSEVSVVFPEPFAPATRVSLGWVTESAKRTAQGAAGLCRVRVWCLSPGDLAAVHPPRPAGRKLLTDVHKTVNNYIQ